MRPQADFYCLFAAVGAEEIQGSAVCPSMTGTDQLRRILKCHGVCLASPPDRWVPARSHLSA